MHEKTGVYKNVSGTSHRMGIALGEEIDLRLFFARWHACLAVTELAANPGNRVEPSLQFFDPHGLAIHKIYVREGTDLAAWHAVIDRFEDKTGEPVTFTPAAAPAAPRADSAVGQGRAAARLGGDGRHARLLRPAEDARGRAPAGLRLAEGRFSYQLTTEAVRALLLNASLEGTPIMCFVGSGGCTQIHSGPVKRIEPMDIRGTQWLNVLDPGFNLHLQGRRHRARLGGRKSPPPTAW